MNTETAVQAFPSLSPDDKRFLLVLARETLTAHLSGRGPTAVTAASAALLTPRASFVTLRRRENGDLRGCRGERTARQALVESVRHMVIASALDDPRFDPVRRDELPDLHIEISALTVPQPIRPEDVVVGRHGLIVFSGHVAGLLLPQVPGAYGWNREQFLGAVCEKAGLSPNAWRRSGARLEAFEAEVWGE